MKFYSVFDEQTHQHLAIGKNSPTRKECIVAAHSYLTSSDEWEGFDFSGYTLDEKESMCAEYGLVVDEHEYPI